MISYLDWEEERERNEIVDNLNIHRLHFTFEETEAQRFVWFTFEESEAQGCVGYKYPTEMGG